MKPFNLEKALAGEPVVTRDGREVTEIAYFHTKDSSEFNVVCIVKGISQWYTKEGNSAINIKTRNDLFMAEPERWVNVYYDERINKFWKSAFYNNEKFAKEVANGNAYYQATIQIKDSKHEN
jgi:hypothetical protein